MQELRILLLCSSPFALPAMQSLIFFKNLKVIAIPEHSTDLIKETKILIKNEPVQLLVLKKKTFAKKLTDIISKYEINTGIMASFSYRLPSSVFDLPSKGFFNIHPGSLPAFRGIDPVFQQIRLKEKLAGVTIHKLDEDFDTGPVIMHEMIKLDPLDTYGTLNEKLALVAGNLLSVLLKLLSMGTKIPERKQDESKAVYYKKQDKFDVMLNWRVMDAEKIVALINACNPWNKGAVCMLNNKVIHLLDGRIIDFQSETDYIPGSIISIDQNGMTVSAMDNKAVIITMIYTDLGFFHSSKLSEFGILPGSRFSILSNSTI